MSFWLSSSASPPPCRFRRPAVLAGGHPADFLKGDVEQLAIDEHGRLTLGPTITRVFDAGVPFVWTAVPGPAGVGLSGHRQRRQGVPRRWQRQGHALLRCARAAGARGAAAARRLGAGRHLARRPRLPCRCRRQRARVLRSRGEVHLGARRRRLGADLRRDRRSQGSRLPCRRRWHRHAAVHVECGPRRFDGLRRRAPHRRHRVTGPGVPARCRRPAVPAARHQPAGGTGAAARQPGAVVRRGPGAAQRRRRQRRRHPDRARAAAGGAGADGDDRDHRDVGGRDADAAARRLLWPARQSSGRRRPLSRQYRRHLGSAVGVARGRAVRPRHRGRRRPGRRDRTQGQALPLERRSAAGQPHRPRARPAGGAIAPRRRPDAGRDVQRRGADARRPRSRRSRHLHVRRPRRPQRGVVGRAVLAGDGAGRGPGRGLDPQRQHADARRGVEPVERAPTPRPTARPSPVRARATCSGA